jgi:hypothetical protein
VVDRLRAGAAPRGRHPGARLTCAASAPSTPGRAWRTCGSSTRWTARSRRSSCATGSGC